MSLRRTLTRHTLVASLCLLGLQCGTPLKQGPKPASESVTTPGEEALKRLTDSSADQLAPSFSADGLRLIYQNNSDGNWEIYTLALEDGRSQRLTDTPDLEEDPSWSPDGKRVLCTTHAPTLDNDAPREILLMDVDGRNRHILASSSADDYCPRFSPDGSLVYFISDRVDTRKDVADEQRHTALFRYDLAEAKLEQVSEPGMWSQPLPTGNRVAIRNGDHTLLWLQDNAFQPALTDTSFIFGQADHLEGRGWVVSHLSEVNDGRLRWRPDESAPWQEWPMDEREAEWTPVFSPDGKGVAFAGRVKGQWDLFLRRLPAQAAVEAAGR